MNTLSKKTIDTQHALIQRCAACAKSSWILGQSILKCQTANKTLNFYFLSFE